MAKVKVSIDQDKFDEFVKRAGIFVSKSYKRDIIADIEKGISPVQARGFFGRGGRYKKYSKSYREQIKEGRFSEFNKRPSPPNLKLSGELLRSLQVVPDKNRIMISFNNFLADIHNRLGAGKSKVVRRMLPTGPNETFNKRISLNALRVLKKVAKTIFR